MRVEIKTKYVGALEPDTRWFRKDKSAWEAIVYVPEILEDFPMTYVWAATEEKVLEKAKIAAEEVIAGYKNEQKSNTYVMDV